MTRNSGYIVQATMLPFKGKPHPYERQSNHVSQAALAPEGVKSIPSKSVLRLLHSFRRQTYLYKALASNNQQTKKGQHFPLNMCCTR